MSLNLKHKSTGSLKNLVTAIRTFVANQGNALAVPAHATALVSTEGLTDNQKAQVESHFEETQANLTRVFQQAGMESLMDMGGQDSPYAKRRQELSSSAAAIAAMALGDPVAYMTGANNVTVSGEGFVDTTLLDNRALGYRVRPALESFDERELRQYAGYSIAFNAATAYQDDFGEAFYRTVLLTPEQTGLEVVLPNFNVFNEGRHAADGKPSDFKKRRLTDAIADATILADHSTKLVPVYAAGAEDNFAPTTAVGTTEVVVAGIPVPTRPLVMGRTLDLLGLSQYQPLLGNGVFDNYDAIDAKVVLSALYLVPEAGEAAIKFNTSRLPRAGFLKSQEGLNRESALNFTTEALILDEHTVDVTGAAPTALAAIAANHWTVKLAVSVSGQLNHELGNLTVFGTAVTVKSIHDQSGNEVSTAAGPGAALKTAIAAMPMAYFDLDANRTNSNQRTQGLILDTTYTTRKFPVPLLAPISAPSTVFSDRDASDLKATIAAARTVIANNTVTALLGYCDHLKEYVSGVTFGKSTPDLEGLGAAYVQPWFEEHRLNVEQALNTVSTGDKAIDISAVLVNACRDVVYRMYVGSRYQAALNVLGDAAGETPTLIVGTDPVTARHLVVNGDTRTFGTIFDKFRLVTSLDERMRGKIVMTFVRENVDGVDPLSFGNLAFIPELTSSLVVNVGGSTIKRVMVQPRAVNVNHLPVAAVINVEGLSNALTSKTTFVELSSPVPNSYLDGLQMP